MIASAQRLLRGLGQAVLAPLAGSITEVEGVPRRRPGVARLSWLHRHHHDPRVMATRNFNITYPIGDWLFGTLERPRG